SRVFVADLCLIVFLYQAEDGIRARNVTGVQTCALPIYLTSNFIFTKFFNHSQYHISCIVNDNIDPSKMFNSSFHCSKNSTSISRSEERRVGKECRSRM